MEAKKIKSEELISWLLGITMFMFGILKVVSPTINGWFSVQMTKSGLVDYMPIWIGIMGEIVTGLALMIILIKRQRISNKIFNSTIKVASVALIFMMVTAIYVHLQPAVPAEVLPLKIKTPFIPVFILLIALSNVYFIQRKINDKVAI